MIIYLFIVLFMNIYFTWSLWWYISLDSVLGSYSMISINYLSLCSAHRHLASLALIYILRNLSKPKYVNNSLSDCVSLSQTLTLRLCLALTLSLSVSLCVSHSDFHRRPPSLCLSPTDCHSNLSHWLHTPAHSGHLSLSAVLLVTCTLSVHCSDHSTLWCTFQYVI